MDDLYNRKPVEKEIKVNPSLVLSKKVSKDGIIQYVNHAFSDVSGYEEYEVIGQSMDMMRHPDTPNLIYNMLQERFESKEPMRLVHKFLAKDGRSFWVISDYETKVDEQGNIIAHYSHSYAASSYAVHKIESIYKILRNIERKSPDTDISQRYFKGFLEERSLSYDDFIAELSVKRPEYEDAGYHMPDMKTRSNPPVAPEVTKEVEKKIEEEVAKPEPAPIATQQQVKPNPRPKPKKKKQKSLLKQVFGK